MVNGATAGLPDVTADIRKKIGSGASKEKKDPYAKAKADCAAKGGRWDNEKKRCILPKEKPKKNQKEKPKKNQKEKPKKNQDKNEQQKQTYSYQGVEVSKEDYNILTGRSGGTLSPEGQKVADEKGLLAIKGGEFVGQYNPAERKRQEELIEAVAAQREGRGEIEQGAPQTFEEFKSQTAERIAAQEKEQQEIEQEKQEGFWTRTFSSDPFNYLTEEQEKGTRLMASAMIGTIGAGGASAKGFFKNPKIPTSVKEVAGRKAAQEAVKKGSRTDMLQWIAIAGGYLASVVGLRDIVEIPTEKIDSMESQAGKVGEFTSEAFNMARAGNVREAQTKLNEAYDLIQQFDEETYRLQQTSVKAKLNPKYIENVRFEYWKSLSEISTAMEEIQQLTEGEISDEELAILTQKYATAKR